MQDKCQLLTAVSKPSHCQTSGDRRLDRARHARLLPAVSWAEMLDDRQLQRSIANGEIACVSVVATRNFKNRRTAGDGHVPEYNLILFSRRHLIPRHDCRTAPPMTKRWATGPWRWTRSALLKLRLQGMPPLTLGSLCRYDGASNQLRRRERDEPNSRLGGSFGRLSGAGHILPVRVYFEDTDFSGLVYHTSYLRWCERGRRTICACSGSSTTNWPRAFRGRALRFRGEANHRRVSQACANRRDY